MPNPCTSPGGRSFPFPPIGTFRAASLRGAAEVICSRPAGGSFMVMGPEGLEHSRNGQSFCLSCVQQPPRERNIIWASSSSSYLGKRVCKMFSESSTTILNLPFWPGKGNKLSIVYKNSYPSYGPLRPILVRCLWCGGSAAHNGVAWRPPHISSRNGSLFLSNDTTTEIERLTRSRDCSLLNYGEPLS